ncbi:hypothetical protein AAVH_23012, partial [Aphelenchoides avenae]
MWISSGGLSPSRFLSAIRNLEKGKIGDWCLLDAQCSWIPNAVCTHSGKCDCQYGKYDGKQCDRPPPSANKTEVVVSNTVTDQLEDTPGGHYHHAAHYRRITSPRMPYKNWYHATPATASPGRYVSYNPDMGPEDGPDGGPSYWGMNGWNGMGNGNMGNMNGGMGGHGMGNGMMGGGHGSMMGNGMGNNMNGMNGGHNGMNGMGGGGHGGMNGGWHGWNGWNGMGGMNGMNGMGFPF